MLAAMSMSITMQAMQVFVNVPGQSQKTIEMELSDSFDNLKAKIEDKTDIAIDRQSLFFNGILMLDDHTLDQDGVTSGSVLDLVIATVHNTSLSMDEVIKFGDKLDIPVPGEYDYFGINGESCLYANNPYTLVRGNIVGDSYWDWEITEAADGAYYIFKDANGDLYASHNKMAATYSTDGLVVDEVSSNEGLFHYFLIPHQRVDEFADNVDGIEAGLEAMEGQTVNLAIGRTFYKDGYFNTICLPISLSQSAIEANYWLGGCEIFEFESAVVNGGTLDLYLNQVYAIEAGKPYLISWEVDSWNPTIPFLYFEGVTIETSVGQAVGTGVQFVGTIGQTQLENGNHDYLFVGANNTLYWPNTDNKLKGFRAYFKVSGDVAPHGAPARMVIRRTPTGVENAQSTELSTKKVLRDGKLIIVRDGIEYNAQGQIVK